MDQPSKPKLSLFSLIKIVVFALIFISIPVITILLGQMTRKQIKADVECKRPYVPDPQECVGGEWKLEKDINGCLHFICTLK
ncbi:hypothetical protein HY041_00735 [Candidatus Roizmanbacteria bacterium]|nr:hypothetical protein [Candidatus Roizmanbacteria bacterium]